MPSKARLSTNYFFKINTDNKLAIERLNLADQIARKALGPTVSPPQMSERCVLDSQFKIFNNVMKILGLIIFFSGLVCGISKTKHRRPQTEDQINEQK